CVTVTSVNSYDYVRTILVISFFTAPDSTAFLLSKKLSTMIWISLMYAAINSLIGGTFGYLTDTSISGSVAVISMISFFLVFLFRKDGPILSKIHLPVS